jgi:hypothetical protein
MKWPSLFTKNRRIKSLVGLAMTWFQSNGRKKMLRAVLLNLNLKTQTKILIAIVDMQINGQEITKSQWIYYSVYGIKKTIN